MDELFADAREPWPEEIIVEPLRLETSLWGYPEGDIQAAYCADTFPNIKTFRHQGQTFTNMGGDGSYAHCYPLLSITDGRMSEPVPYSREGDTVIFQGQKYKLGPKVKFTIRERTLEEGVDLLRRQYAYGGYFASGKTYREVLLNFRERDALRSGRRRRLARNWLGRNFPKPKRRCWSKSASGMVVLLPRMKTKPRHN